MEVRHCEAWAARSSDLHRHTILDQISHVTQTFFYCFRCMAQTTRSVSL